MLKRGGLDVAAAKSQLSQLESRQARHIVDRNRLFKERLTIRSRLAWQHTIASLGLSPIVTHLSPIVTLS